MPTSMMMTSMLIDTTHHNRRSNTIPRKTLFWGLLIHIIRVSILVMDPSCSWGRRILRPKGSGKFKLWKSSVWQCWRTLSVRSPSHPFFEAIVVVHCGLGVCGRTVAFHRHHCTVLSYVREQRSIRLIFGNWSAIVLCLMASICPDPPWYPV